MESTTATHNTAIILNLEWTSASMRNSGDSNRDRDLMEAEFQYEPIRRWSGLTPEQVEVLQRGARVSPLAHTLPEYPAALTRVEPEDLARFEGEGGLGEPEPAVPRHR